MLRLKKWLVFPIILWSISSYAQLGTWNILNVRFKLNDQLGLFGEGQIRSLQFYNQFHYYEFKGGIDYKLNEQLRVTLGAGSYQTYKEGGNFLEPKNNNEFRLWPQIQFQHKIGMLRIEQRYRAELRFTSNGYRNRFRYRFGLSLPLRKKENYHQWQLTANNELFFTNKEPYFERNRFSVNIQYRVNPILAFQVGYLYQFDYKINDETGRDFLQLGISLEFSKKTKSISN
jgi:hypothetical protein